jgi:PAS domain S-box-containing protein
VPPARRPRILVVDDEAGPRESLRMLLKPRYEVRTAEGARAAMQELPQFRPDLVILDIKMPDADGLEVLRRIKEADASIEVVMITAYASLETVKQALSHGAFEYLVKPFARQDLEDVVRRALDRRLAAEGARDQVQRLVEEMRSLAGKAQRLEEASRRETAEQSLRVTQLSLLREMARTVVAQLDLQEMIAAVTGLLQRALRYDVVTIACHPALAPPDAGRCVAAFPIRDAQGSLGHLVVDNRSSRRPIDAREREVLEMLAEYLAIGMRNARLYSEIADTKRSLEQLVASAGDAIITVGPDDRVQGWNPAAERVFGLPAARALGSSITAVLPDRPYAEAKARLALGVTRDAFEVSLPRPDGPPTTLAVTLSALGGLPAGREGLIAIVRDITMEREAESQLHQSEKLRALGQLAGGIAHDFNNLLQAILGYSQLMKQNMDDARLLARSLGVLESVALDGAETVRRIQQFARLRADEQLVAVDVNEVVQESVAIIRPRLGEKVNQEGRHLELALDLRRVPPIRGRAAALNEALTNLLLNAIDAMPEGGRLTLSTRAGDGTAVITVSDTGIGMSEEVRRRIFEPFFSTKGEAGSGLGLAMAYSIVRRHGGDIRVDSTVGRGSTFTLTFPVEAQQPLAAPPPAPTPGRWRPARVLVIDDDANVLGTLSELLHTIGHQVTAARGGAAGLDAFTRDRFDVVLTNIGMPGMNGWQVAERLRAVAPAVPLLFVTGWGLRDDDHGRLAALKVDRCLFKPVRPTDLDSAIQAALGTV